MFSNIAFHPLNYPICSHSHFYFSSLIDSVSNPGKLPVTIVREVLRCRITGWAVALPGSLSSLKVGFWKGRLMVPSCCGAWGVTCSLPGTAPLECGGGFVYIPIYESGEAGDKKQELNASMFPINVLIHVGEGKAEEDLCLTAWLLVPRTVPRTFVCVEPMDHCCSWGFCPKEPLRCEEQKDPLKREELGHWDLFSQCN